MHTCARTPAHMRARSPSGQRPIQVTPLSALPSTSPSPASRGQLCMDTSGCGRGAPGAFPVLARLCHLSGCNTVRWLLLSDHRHPTTPPLHCPSPGAQPGALTVGPKVRKEARPENRTQTQTAGAPPASLLGSGISIPSGTPFCHQRPSPGPVD